jgi:8-oxo-dGTP pyrophosphatase MutT (NUDIX family)
MKDESLRNHSFDWTTVESKYISKHKWMTLRQDICRMPDGTIVDPYFVLEFPPWCNVVALTEDEQVVMVRQYRHGIKKTLLELPCGYVDAEDASPLTAMKRELREETGYTGEEFIETGQLSPNPANHDNITHCFLATDVRKVSEPKLDDSEQIEVVLIPLKSLLHMIEKGEIIQSLHISSVLKAMKTMGRLKWG